MTRQALDDFVASARAGKTEAPRRVNAMWAGLEAVKLGIHTAECPFEEGEADLVAGFQRGVAIATRLRPDLAPVFDLTPARLRSHPARADGNTFAAQSVPKEEE